MGITYDLTKHFQSEIHRPSFPYKFKIKCSGCPNDCAVASARSDLAIMRQHGERLRAAAQAVGAGLVMDEVMDIRLKLGQKKAGQVKAVGRLDYLAIPCSICKAQSPPVMKHYAVQALEMGGVMDLVGKALNPGGNGA